MRKLTPADQAEFVERFRADAKHALAHPGLKAELAYARCAGNLMALRGHATCGLKPEEVLPLLKQPHPTGAIAEVFLKETFSSFVIPPFKRAHPTRP